MTVEQLLRDALSTLAKAREQVIAHALDCDATPHPRPMCRSCGGTDPNHPMWVNLFERCGAHSVVDVAEGRAS